MKNETITFDKLPEAVGYLTEQVIELRMLAVSSVKRKLRCTGWCRKAFCLHTRKERSSISTKMNCWHGLKTAERKHLPKAMKRCLLPCKTEYVISPNPV